MILKSWWPRLIPWWLLDDDDETIFIVVNQVGEVMRLGQPLIKRLQSPDEMLARVIWVSDIVMIRVILRWSEWYCDEQSGIAMIRVVSWWSGWLQLTLFGQILQMQTCTFNISGQVSWLESHVIDLLLYVMIILCMIIASFWMTLCLEYQMRKNIMKINLQPEWYCVEQGNVVGNWKKPWEKCGSLFIVKIVLVWRQDAS